MAKALKNTFALVKFIFKTERIVLPLYLLSMTAFLVGLWPVFDEMLASASNMEVLIETMRNPAMISMVGPVFVEDTYTTGSMYANYMTVFSAIMVAIWNILFMVKHTRLNEEQGRSELVRSLPVGRYANEAASLIIAFLVNLVMGFLMIIGFKVLSPDASLNSIVNLSLSIVAFGFLFAVMTLLFAQLSNTARIASSLSFLTLLISYLLRATGDVSKEVLSLISPLGLVTRTESFVNDYYWPLLILALEIIVILILAIFLLSRRDLDSGLLKERPGRRGISPFIKGVPSFTLKLLAGQLVIWALVLLTFSAMYGSTLGDLEGYINSSEIVKQMLVVNSDFSLTEQFVGLLVLIMSMIATIPVINFVKRILTEERHFLSEEILNQPVSRYTYFASFILVSVLAAIGYQALVATGFWLVGRQVMEDLPDLEVFMVACFNYLPAILVTLGLAIFLIGCQPRLSWLAYLYLGYSFMVIYIGRMFDLPEFMEKLTPFGLLPNYPIEKLDYGMLGILMGVFLLLTYLGLKFYRHRDLNS